MRNIIGNTRAIRYLENESETGSVAHAYLFHGPSSVGKTAVAVEFARKQICSAGGADDCSCHDCQLVATHSHPDLIVSDGREIGIDEIRELTNKLELKNYQARNKVAIIRNADCLSIPALNAFLKTLEEPKDDTMIILTAENKDGVLPTIISRCRLVSFSPLTEKEIFAHLNLEAGVKKELATEIASVAGGRLGYALLLATSPERAKEIIHEGQEYLRIYRSDSILDKISLAGKIAAEKVDMAERITNIVIYLRKLLNDAIEGSRKELDPSQIVSAITDLSEAAKMIKGNVNPKLALEAALFGSISR